MDNLSIETNIREYKNINRLLKALILKAFFSYNMLNTIEYGRNDGMFLYIITLLSFPNYTLHLKQE
jgi:hypothetical protein